MIASKVVRCFDDFKKELSYSAVFLFVLLSVIRYLYVSGGIYFDSVEHIYASWLISDGKQPYKDFFEHHNPLLWYLFAPVTKFFYRDIMIFYVARAMALAGNFACMYMVYKIVLSIYDKRSAVFAILMLFIFPMWGDILTFRPDVFMSLFFLLSVFWNIKYLDYAKRRYLLLSYCSLVISFAFLQKVAFLGVGFVLANCCLVIKNKIKIKDFFIAGFSALALLLLMISFLWYEGILAEWWHYNFIYNMQLKTYYRTYESGMPYYLKPFALLIGVAVIRFFKMSDKGLIVILPWFMAGISLLMFFPHTQYVYNFIYLSAIILGGAFAKYNNKFVLYVGFCACFVGAFYNMLPLSYERKFYETTVKTMRYILENSSPKDKVMLLTNRNYNLYQPQIDYYWFGVDNAVIVDVLYNNKRDFDMEELIKEEKPKYLSVSSFGTICDTHSFYNGAFFRYRNSLMWRKSLNYPKYKDKLQKYDFSFFKVDTDWLNNNYEQVEDLPLWRRKDNQ